VQTSRAHELLGLKQKDNCWICEGWSELRFELVTDKTEANVYIHFEFEDYKADFIEKGLTPGLFEIYRMIPPGTYKYFFSIDGIYKINEQEDQVHVEGVTSKIIKDKMIANFPLS
jgi:hypothetical protein